MTVKVIPEQVVEIEGVAEIPLDLWGFVDDGLDRFLSAIPDCVPARDAMGVSIYDHYDVDPVYLEAMRGM